MTYHVILLVMILRYFIKSIFTYHLTLSTSRYTKSHHFIAIEILHWWEMRPLVLLAIILLQFWSLLTNISLLGLVHSTSEIIRELDYLIKSYNWRKYTKQNQLRMVLVWRMWLFFRKYCALKTSVVRPKSTAR